MQLKTPASQNLPHVPYIPPPPTIVNLQIKRTIRYRRYPLNYHPVKTTLNFAIEPMQSASNPLARLSNTISSESYLQDNTHPLAKSKTSRQFGTCSNTTRQFDILPLRRGNCNTERKTTMTRPFQIHLLFLNSVDLHGFTKHNARPPQKNTIVNNVCILIIHSYYRHCNVLLYL